MKLREANTSRSFFHARSKEGERNALQEGWIRRTVLVHAESLVPDEVQLKEERNAKKTKEALCHTWLPKPDGWTLL